MPVLGSNKTTRQVRLATTLAGSTKDKRIIKALVLTRRQWLPRGHTKKKDSVLLAGPHR
jgi:hypothetical protein